MSKLLKCISFLCIFQLFSMSLTACSAEETDSSHLVLACWVADYTITEIVNQYNLEHPELPIEITEYISEDIDPDVAIQKMNAALIAGQSADIYCFDSMNLQGLINAGLVMDLNKHIKPDQDFTDDNYNMDILRMFEQGGCLYEMPCCFQVAGICLPRDTIGSDISGWTTDEYIAFDQNLAESGRTVLQMSPQLMLEYMSQYSMSAFVDNSACQFDTSEFYETLEFIRDYAEGNGGMPLGYDTWIFGIPSYASDKQKLGTTPQYLGYPDSERNGPCAFALMSFGISSTTSFPEECWTFIKRTTDTDIYLRYFSSLGFSLSYEAMECALELYTYPTDDTRSPLYGMTNDDDEYYSPISTEDYDAIYSLMDSITHARYRYDGIFDIISEEGQAYFAGDKDTVETARLIQNRASIYLSEQS